MLCSLHSVLVRLLLGVWSSSGSKFMWGIDEVSRRATGGGGFGDVKKLSRVKIVKAE